MKLLERDISQQITDFMEAHGWRSLRMQSGMFKNPAGNMFRVGEPGMPDKLFIHYLLGQNAGGLAVHLWVEMKSPTDKRRCECARRAKQRKPGKCGVCLQGDWKQREIARGALIWMGHDFELFQSFYAREFGWLSEERI